MDDTVNAPKPEEPVVSLSDDESRMVQRMLRASRRDVEQFAISTDLADVEIKMFALTMKKIPYKDALAMDDAAWKNFFADNPPLL